MKKALVIGSVVILLSIIVLSFMANASSPIEKDVRRYLEEKEKYIVALEILEVSDVVDMYSPFENILGHHWILMDASEKSNYGKIKPEYEKDFLRVEEFINEIEPIIGLKYYTNSVRSANRRGVICKYRLNGILEENAFYYENNNSKIGHDFKAIEKIYSSLLDTYFEVKRDNRKYE